jgi:hypothetical protein
VGRSGDRLGTSDSGELLLRLDRGRSGRQRGPSARPAVRTSRWAGWATSVTR